MLDLTVPKPDDPVGLLGHGHVMGDQHQCDAQLPADGPQEGQHLPSGLAVQIAVGIQLAILVNGGLTKKVMNIT